VNAGWKRTTLGDVLAELKNGLNCKQSQDGQGQRISRIESIADGTFDEGRVGFSSLSEAEMRRFRLKHGDILFSHINSPPHVGKVAHFSSTLPIYHGVNLLLMRPSAGIESRYLFYFLQSLRDSGYWKQNCKQSVNQASVNQKDICKVTFDYPTDLEEQRRIVAVLDEAFAAIATATANAEKNLENARELYRASIDQHFANEIWPKRSLHQITSVFDDGDWIESKDQSLNGIRLVPGLFSSLIYRPSWRFG
jgi:type I restriction enzyme S subunit